MRGMNRAGIIGGILAAVAVASAQTVPPLVQQKCSVCHPVPRPASLPRHAWEEAQELMEELMAEKGIPFPPEERSQILAYYEDNSPEVLPRIPDLWPQSRIPWSRGAIGLPPQMERPQITSLRVLDIDGDSQVDDLICTDNNMGAVTWIHRVEGRWREKVLAFVPGPVRATPIDFDGDGDLDLAVSCMGEIHPNELLIGELHLLLNDGNGVFQSKMILEGVPRITDCAPADYDGDGDIDFALAMFGWRKTGGISLLRQGEGGEFSLESVIELNGAMRILVNDSNRDEKPDFIALFAQQHESIVQFENDGKGSFSNRIITRASHPAFGSSNIKLRDLDGDGDEDILYTNGDMMDENPEPKPYHGVRWLENKGDGGYELHHLANMPGCYDAEPVDLDGDGDLDLVISNLYFQWNEDDFPSLAWLENLGGFRAFSPQKIAYAPSNLANIAIGDLDQDGKPDIVGGGMHVPGPIERRGRVTLWMQE